MTPITIRSVRTIVTAPDGVDLAIVKVDTSEPGLSGLGCATFTQRIASVQSAIDEYLAPWAIGRDVDRIEDILDLSQDRGQPKKGTASLRR